jgi:predicted RNA-binding Zn ribbon-like protein
MQAALGNATLIADFLNSLDVRSFGAHASHPPVDEIATPDALRRWLIDRGRLRGGEAASPADHRTAVRLRDGLRELLKAQDSEEDLNAIASRLALVVSFEDGEPRLAGGDSAVTAYLAEILSACARAAADGSWPLIKMCAAEDCHWVFVDRSRNRKGRWCATRVCGNRVKTRRYRERHRSRPARREAS